MAQFILNLLFDVLHFWRSRNLSPDHMCLRLRVRLCDKSNSLLRLVGGVGQTHTTHATVLGGCPLFELLLIILRSQWHDWPVLGHRLSHTWNCHLALGGAVTELLRDA